MIFKFYIKSIKFIKVKIIYTIMNKTALIVTIGKATEPTVKRINGLKPDLVYFIHSKKSKENSLFIIEETNLKNYRFKLLDDHESVDDAFAKASECINELKKEDYIIITDFTVGTKPMTAGLVMASVEHGCDYKYVGEADENSREEELGPVKSGFEKNKDQENPYEKYAINEFKSGREFFDKYQFSASLENFTHASDKLNESDLKLRSDLFIKIVSFYDNWDKFNFQNDLENIVVKIDNNPSLNEYFTQEIPNFYMQMKNNLIFLNKNSNSMYYLPDLLNNAERRICEGKYDDAVARLYRSLELIAQLQLVKFRIVDEYTLKENRTFQIDKEKLKKKASKKSLGLIDTWNPYGWNHSNKKYLERLDLAGDYRLLDILSKERKNDLERDSHDLYQFYLKIVPRVKLRNKSILAHGLNALDERDALTIYKLIVKQSEKLCPNIKKEMEIAKFPLFKEE